MRVTFTFISFTHRCIDVMHADEVASKNVNNNALVQQQQSTVTDEEEDDTPVAEASDRPACRKRKKKSLHRLAQIRREEVLHSFVVRFHLFMCLYALTAGSVDASC